MRTGPATSTAASGRLAGDAPNAAFPLNHSITVGYAASLAVALLTAGASGIGIAFTSEVYPTPAIRDAFLANDYVNLFVGLPALLFTLWLARRGRLIGLLLWPGALLYGLYNYLTYLFALPFNIMFPFALAITVLSTYTVIGIAAAVDGAFVRQQLAAKVYERLTSGALIVFGVLFLANVVALAVSGLNGEAIAQTKVGLMVADAFLAVALIIGGVLLWRRIPLGYVSGPALWFLFFLLSAGALVVVLLRPVLTQAEFKVVDVVVLAGMVVVSALPTFLFTRSLLRSGG